MGYLKKREPCGQRVNKLCFLLCYARLATMKVIYFEDTDDKTTY